MRRSYLPERLLSYSSAPMSEHDDDLPEPAFLSHYELRLLYFDEPVIDRESWTAALARWLPGHQLEEEKGGSTFRLESPAGELIEIGRVSPVDAAEVEAAAGQSWNWREGREIGTRCRFALTIVDHTSGFGDYRGRADLLRRAASAALEAGLPDAVLSVPTEQLLEPRDLLDSLSSDPRDPLYGFVNIRYYKVEGYEEGIDAEFDESVMDTMGLGALGLPDIQMHYKHLDPSLVAQLIYETAHYLWENGPVIDTGHTIEGITAGQEFICRLEGSVAEPYRLVVDIDPGKPYAAGR
jgi:hypothetical protein